MSDINGMTNINCSTDRYEGEKFPRAVEVNGVCDFHDMADVYWMCNIDNVTDVDGMRDSNWKGDGNGMCNVNGIADVDRKSGHHAVAHIYAISDRRRVADVCWITGRIRSAGNIRHSKRCRHTKWGGSCEWDNYIARATRGVHDTRWVK
jgi:hypothetical protein